MGIFHANPVAPRWAIGFVGAIENVGDISIEPLGAQILLQPTPSIKYCTYTLIISSDFSKDLSEVLNSE